MIDERQCRQAVARLFYNNNKDQRDFDLILELINEHFDNPPLKFEELHDKMWVWDNKYKEYCYIYFIAGVYPHRKYIDNCESDGAFEENRFYRYEVKENG